MEKNFLKFKDSNLPDWKKGWKLFFWNSVFPRKNEISTARTRAWVKNRPRKKKLFGKKRKKETKENHATATGKGKEMKRKEGKNKKGKFFEKLFPFEKPRRVSGSIPPPPPLPPPSQPSLPPSPPPPPPLPPKPRRAPMWWRRRLTAGVPLKKLSNFQLFKFNSLSSSSRSSSSSSLLSSFSKPWRRCTRHRRWCRRRRRRRRRRRHGFLTAFVFSFLLSFSHLKTADFFSIFFSWVENENLAKSFQLSFCGLTWLLWRGWEPLTSALPPRLFSPFTQLHLNSDYSVNSI